MSDVIVPDPLTTERLYVEAMLTVVSVALDRHIESAFGTKIAARFPGASDWTCVPRRFDEHKPKYKEAHHR